MSENEIKNNSLFASETAALPAVDPSNSASAAEAAVIPAAEAAPANVTAEMPAVEAPSPVASDDSTKDEGKKKGKKQKPVKVKRTAKGWFTTILGTIIGLSVVVGMVYLAGYYYIGTRLGDNWEQKALEMNNEGMAALKTELESFDEGKQEELKSKVEILPDIAYEVFIKPVEKVPELAPKLVDLAKSYVNHMVNGDEIVTMGEFQGEPLTWFVLTEKDGKKLLLSQNVIDVQPYAYSREAQKSWASSPVRGWLNGTLYYAAFDDDERARIVASDVPNEVIMETDRLSHLEPLDSTEDRLFCLSYTEFSDYASPVFYAKAKPTAYAAQKDITVDDGYVGWYLRSQAVRPYQENLMMCVASNGGMGSGQDVDAFRKPYGVRPAMWITAE